MPSVTPLLVSRASARVRPVGALWRLRGYLKPFRTQMIVMFAAALGAVAAEIAIPLLTKSVDRRRDRARRQADADPAGPGGGRPRRGRGRAEYDPPLDPGRRGRGHREVDQGRHVRPPAAAARVLPRQLAVGPASLEGDDRPVIDPQVRGLRPDLPGHQRDDVRRGGRVADQPQLVARPAHRRGVRAGAAGLLPVREALPGALPPGSGPAGRPGHADRGSRHRRPGAEGAGPGAAGRGQARRPGR